MTLVDLHLGRPLVRGPLTLFPVFNGGAVASRGYVLAPDVVEVAEREGAAVVAQLVVTNPSSRPALVLEGDLLHGGQQDRVAGRSVLVPAGQGHVLDVFCTEAGRWHGGAAHTASGLRAPVEVRAALGADQGEVWRRVERYGERYGRGETGALRDAAAGAADAAHGLVGGLTPLAFQCGVLVGVGGQPLLLEVVDSPRTFAQLWRGLLGAVALDALGAPPVPTPGRRARRFADRVLAAPCAVTGDAGAGRTLQARSPHADVRALTWRGRTVHAAALNVRHPLVAA